MDAKIPFVAHEFYHIFNRANSQADKLFFQEHPKSVLVKKEEHLLWLVYYIHKNPVHHGVASSFWNWKYSSLQALSNNMPTKLERTRVWKLFGGKQAMLEFHKQKSNVKDIGYILLDSSEG